MSTQLKSLLLLSTLLSVVAAPAVYATEETTDPYEDNLLPDWKGMRSKLSDAGVDVTVEYKADFWDVASGGIKTGRNFNDNLDVKFAIDGEKMFGIHGNKAMIYFVNNEGGRPNATRIGSLQGIDNIEVAKSTPKLYEAWVDQSFFADKLSILVGLHDLNSEFIETDSTANFIKPVMQIGPEFALSGQNGPSIFPNTALAVRAKFLPTEDTYIQGGVFDGVAGDPDHLYGNQFQFDGGALLIAEAGYIPKLEDGTNMTKFAVGAWSYTQKFDDMNSVDAFGNPLKKRSEGAYLLSSYQFYYDKTTGHSATVFFRPGIADGDTKPVDWAYEAGIVTHGWVPTRADSEIGLGFTQSHNSDKFIRAAVAAGGQAEHNEYGAELYYRDKLYHGISIQPDLQYVANPALNPQVSNSWILGTRLDINF